MEICCELSTYGYTCSKRLHKPVEYHVVFLAVAEKRLHHVVQYVENPETSTDFIKKI
jgi:hypothetical protein